MKITKNDISPNANYDDGKAFASENAFEQFKGSFAVAKVELRCANLYVRQDSKLSKIMWDLLSDLEDLEVEYIEED
jgi:hypothetical protein